jgi:hypothetical protein
LSPPCEVWGALEFAGVLAVVVDVVLPVVVVGAALLEVVVGAGLVVVVVGRGVVFLVDGGACRVDV